MVCVKGRKLGQRGGERQNGKGHKEGKREEGEGMWGAVYLVTYMMIGKATRRDEVWCSVWGRWQGSTADDSGGMIC